MHIAFLTPEYPHSKLNSSAGLGTSIKNLATELVRKGIKVSVFVYSQNENNIIENNGITIYKIAHKKYSYCGWYFYRKQLQKVINTHIIQNNIDLIEASDWTGITAFMNFKCPLLIRLHGTDAYFCNLENRKQKWKNFYFEKKALKNADKIVSVSAFTAQKTKDIFGLKRKLIDVIHNGINVDDFKPQTQKINKNQILYFGSIIRKKGILELAKAFDLLVKMKPEVTLVLVGKDVVDIFEKKSTITLFFESISKESKEKVIYLKEVSYDQISSIIAQANIITLPSFAEAFPMTWLETMAMEKAFVSSNIGWASELMNDGKTGFMVNPKNHQEYAEKMKQLLENDALAKSFGKASRNVILDRFEAKKIAQMNIDLYNRIIQY